MHEIHRQPGDRRQVLMLPTGNVIPFSHFFVANLSIKHVIKDLVEHETTPLTDQELAELLLSPSTTSSPTSASSSPHCWPSCSSLL
jgi:hypothetical protein